MTWRRVRKVGVLSGMTRSGRSSARVLASPTRRLFQTSVTFSCGQLHIPRSRKDHRRVSVAVARRPGELAGRASALPCPKFALRLFYSRVATRIIAFPAESLFTRLEERAYEWQETGEVIHHLIPTRWPGDSLTAESRRFRHLLEDRSAFFSDQ